MTQQDTKREKGTRKEGRKGGRKGRRTSPLAKVGRSREGFTLFWGLRDPRCHFLAATWKLAEKTRKADKIQDRRYESRILVWRKKVGRGFRA